MMPGAGLYLPDTLSKPLDCEDRPTSRQKLSERKSSQDSESNPKSVALSRQSSQDATRFPPSQPMDFDFADTAAAQGKISSDDKALIDHLQRLRRDMAEASRLYTSKAIENHFDSWPDEKTRLESIFRDTEHALNDISLLLQTVRVSGDDGGTVGFRRKFEWAFSHRKKLEKKHQILTLCHQDLTAAMQNMQIIESQAAFEPVYEMPAQPWMQNESSDVMRSPHSRQKWRTNHRNSSVPSITISEPDVKDGTFAHTQQFAVAELPGSTPDDLPWLSKVKSSPEPDGPRRDSVNEARRMSTHGHDPEPVLHNEAMGLSERPTTADAKSAPNPRRRPSDQSLDRRSFDHARYAIAALEDRASASFDQARPRSYSDQIRTRRSFEVKSRASTDQVRPMPTLIERPVERFNSTASIAVGDAVSVPFIRDRSKPVLVKRGPVKHQSLPNPLPSFPNQTSLMEDLSSWIIPQPTRESHLSIQTDDASVSISKSTPATSVASSPVILNAPASCPTTIVDTIPIASAPAAEDRPNPDLGKVPIASSPTSGNSSLFATRPALQQSSSLPPPMSPKVPIIPLHERSKTLQSKSNEDLQRADSGPILPPLARRRRPVRSPKEPIEETPKGLSASPISLTSSGSSGLPTQEAVTVNNATIPEVISQEHLPSTVTILPADAHQGFPDNFPCASPADKYPMTLSPTASLPIPVSPVQSPPSGASSVENLASDAPQTHTTSRPMTALEKRREAHRRRMQAYGSESDDV